MNRQQMVDRLAGADHEGIRLHPYTDTVGKLSIGIGRNLSDDGITAEEAELLCTNDVISAETDLDRHVPWWRNMSEVRQQALCELAFWLGWPKLSQFHEMLAKLEVGNTTGASEELLNSALAREIPGRTRIIASAIRHNTF